MVDLIDDTPIENINELVDDTPVEEINVLSEDTQFAVAGVESVNGKTGVVVINASDVNALPNTTKYGKSLSVSGRNVTLKDQNGNNLSTIQTQDTTYTAGRGISITNRVISNTQTSAEWGNITGALNNQTDLKNALGAKQNAITATNKLPYSLISGTPTIPTKTSQLTNDSQYQTYNQVQAIKTEIENEIPNVVDNTTSTSVTDALSANQGRLLNTAITQEIAARQTADAGLQSQIDAITSASDVVDVVGTYAELQAYDTQHLKDNDIVKVLVDETKQNAITYYRWSTSSQSWTYIGSQGPFYTKSESDELLADKQDIIPDLTSIRDGAAAGSTALQPSALNGYATEQYVNNYHDNSKQDSLTAGEGIDITNNVISATSTGGGTWGSITGTLSDQTDLQDALDAKQDELEIEEVDEIEVRQCSGYDVVTTIGSSSTDLEIPTAKCLYDIVGNIETALDEIRGV